MSDTTPENRKPRRHWLALSLILGAAALTASTLVAVQTYWQWGYDWPEPQSEFPASSFTGVYGIAIPWDKEEVIRVRLERRVFDFFDTPRHIYIYSDSRGDFMRTTHDGLCSGWRSDMPRGFIEAFEAALATPIVSPQIGR